MIHNTVLENYIINSNTLAIVPARNIHFSTVVHEKNRVFKVKKTPMEIIKYSCLLNLTTYEGRIETVRQITGFQHKVPLLFFTFDSVDISNIKLLPLMPILAMNPELLKKPTVNIMCFFPTRSPKHYDNIWVAHHHLSKQQRPEPDLNNRGNSTIYFKNGKSLYIDVSTHTLREQYRRSVIIKDLSKSMFEESKAANDPDHPNVDDSGDSNDSGEAGNSTDFEDLDNSDE